MQPLRVANMEKDGGDSALRRNFACQSYQNCLNLSVDNGWGGFSCERCEHRHEEREDWELVQVRDALRIRRLLAKAMRKNWTDMDEADFWGEIAPDRLEAAFRERKQQTAGKPPRDGLAA